MSALNLIHRIIPMNRPLAMALWLSTALLLSACSDSQQSDGKSDSSKRVDKNGQGNGNGKTAPAPSAKVAEPRADDEKEAVAVLVKAKAILKFDKAGHVTSASFREAKISEEALSQLAKLKKLSALRLDGHDRGVDGKKEAQIQDGDLQYIEGLTQLVNLHLGDNYITDKGLKRLAGLTNLKWLLLNDTDITDAGLVHLRGLSHLEWLELQNTSITNTGLEDIKAMPSLTRICLNGSLVTDEGVRALQAAISKDVTIVYQFQSDEPDDDGP